MESYLSRIRSPQALKKLAVSDLKELASEIRERIIQILAVNGGHLASNLGTVELTLALHYVFNSPEDQFVFDVSHQTYTHKLLTERNNHLFDKIRQYQGLSGFANPKESLHDHFYAGHAGTALSLALGLAHSALLTGSTSHVIPIIGDATLTCGLSLEALNNIHKDLPRFIVILNDNAMSISHNVGGITHILSRLLNNPTTSKWVHELELLVSKIPGCGTKLAKQGQKIAESIKNLVSEASFFEQFGLSYIGPLDGHDLKKMVAVFEAIRDLPMPVIVHILTKKGQGLLPAERDPITYHGVKPFDPTTCEFLPTSKEMTFPKIFGKELMALGKQNPKLAVITPAMSLGSCLEGFRAYFPERFFDVGIAEGHAVSFAGGLAKRGELDVVCSIYSTFFQRALDNLFHDVCLQEIPVVFAVDRAGLAAGDGATHHGIYEVGFLRALPNMVICQPRNGQLLKELLHASFSWKQPTAIRYPNLPTEETELPYLRARPLGVGERLADGEDLLIVAVGHHYKTAFALRALLSETGLTAAIVDPIFLKPLDRELFFNLFREYRYVVTIEEHALPGGMASQLQEFLFSELSGANVELLACGVPNLYIEQGSYQELLNEIGLTAEKIYVRLQERFASLFSSIDLLQSRESQVCV